MPKRDFLVRESELDDFQRKLLRRISNIIVEGCAGSGKSLTALWRAHDIFKNREGSVLFVVYNKSLLMYMREAGKIIGLPPSLFESYNKCFNWGKDPETGEFIPLSWRKASYDYIIVDEAQDCDGFHLQGIMEHSRFQLFYGDDEQKIYDQSLSLSEIRRYIGYETEYLTRNYRLPKKIARIAAPLSNDPDIVDRCINEGTELPYIISYSNFEYILDKIRELIVNKNYDDVAILFDRKDDVIRACTYYQNTGFEFEKKIDNSVSLNFLSTLPKIMPYKSSKGLQFETVFVFMPETYSRINREISSIYVAITRSYKNLFVFYGNDLPGAMKNIPSDLYLSSFEREVEEI